MNQSKFIKELKKRGVCNKEIDIAMRFEKTMRPRDIKHRRRLTILLLDVGKEFEDYQKKNPVDSVFFLYQLTNMLMPMLPEEGQLRFLSTINRSFMESMGRDSLIKAMDEEIGKAYR